MNKYTQFLAAGEVKRIRMKARVTPELVQMLSNDKRMSMYFSRPVNNGQFVYISIDSNDLIWTPHDDHSLISSIKPKYQLITMEHLAVLMLVDTFDAMEAYLDTLE